MGRQITDKESNYFIVVIKIYNKIPQTHLQGILLQLIMVWALQNF